MRSRCMSPGGGCSCYASPINRAARFAEIMWEGRETPLVHTDSLKEAYLGWLQGMKQGAQPCRPRVRTPRILGGSLFAPW